MLQADPHLPSSIAERLQRELPVLGASAAERQALFEPSLHGSERDAGDFAKLETCCTFIGYPRSGHSIIGSLLDAHPEVIIAHELDTLKFVQAGFSAGQIFWLLRENSRICAAHGRRWGPYSYGVPGHWQGRHQTLRVIGDNKGGRTTRAIAQDWSLLERLLTTIPLRHRFLHVVRNPFDNIATLTLRQTKDLGQAIELYFGLCRTNYALRQHLGAAAVLDIHHEEFIRRPQEELARICSFLGIAPGPDYLAACASIVYQRPHQSRHGIDWPPALQAAVTEEMKNFAFLSRYAFDE